MSRWKGGDSDGDKLAQGGERSEMKERREDKKAKDSNNQGQAKKR